MKRFALAAAAALAASSAAAMEGITLDVDRDGFASRAEVAQVLGNVSNLDFRAIDNNNDGRLSVNELQADGARSIIARYEVTGNTLVGIDAVDTNNNGFASFGELAAVYSGLTPADFNQIDLNSDNRVSFSELYNPVAQSVVSRYEQPSSAIGLADIDVDGDNFGSFSELVAVYPDLSGVDFKSIDTNNDSRVSFTELYTLETQEVLGRAGS